jgi:replicative DNA helicase
MWDEHGLEIIVIDGVQTVGSDGRGEQKRAVSCGELKVLAEELQVPVVAVYQTR